MKSLIMALAIVLGSGTFAHASDNFAENLAGTPINVKPTADQAVCLKREYSEDHLREYPKQKLSSMYIIVKVAKVEGSTTHETYTAAEVIGQKAYGNKEYYANWDASCEFPARGTKRTTVAHCMVECDGGSFDLLPRPVDVLFSVSKSYFFPLYRPGMSRETATDADTITLDAKDQHNAIYRLYQAPIRECVEARKHAKKINGDC